MSQLERNTRPGLTYRESRNTLTKMAAVKLGPAHIELVITHEDLSVNEGAAFNLKIQEALRDNPKTLVLNLTGCRHLGSTSLGLLLRARADAVRQGIKFSTRPATRETVAMLTGLGLDKILGVAA